MIDEHVVHGRRDGHGRKVSNGNGNGRNAQCARPVCKARDGPSQQRASLHSEGASTTLASGNGPQARSGLAGTN